VYTIVRSLALGLVVLHRLRREVTRISSRHAMPRSIRYLRGRRRDPKLVSTRRIARLGQDLTSQQMLPSRQIVPNRVLYGNAERIRPIGVQDDQFVYFIVHPTHDHPESIGSRFLVKEVDAPQDCMEFDLDPCARFTADQVFLRIRERMS
jgi:hypothetical protein